MAKINLANGRTVVVNGLPLGESGDNCAELLAQIADGPDLRERRKVFREFAIAAIKLFNPDIEEAAIVNGVNMDNLDTTIAAINGHLSADYESGE